MIYHDGMIYNQEHHDIHRSLGIITMVKLKYLCLGGPLGISCRKEEIHAGVQ